MPIQWSNWASLGKPAETEIGSPFVQRNQDGRLEVFARGQGAIFNLSQTAPDGPWSNEWHSKGKPSAEIGFRAHAVGRNADGRLEMFAVGEDNSVWQRWQVAPNNGWVDHWNSFGKLISASFSNQFTVGTNQDGRQELFAVVFIDSDVMILQNWQTAPNGGWNGWRSALPGIIPTGQTAGLNIRESDRITVARNADGRQELFAMAVDEALWHTWQTVPNGGWSAWESLGKPRDAFPEPKDRDLTQPVVKRNADGHLEVFAPGNGGFCNRWQEQPLNIPLIRWRFQGWNAKPTPTPQVKLTSLEAALNVSGPLNGHIEAFGLGDDGALWHAWQIDEAPNWSKWESLGSPAVGIRTADAISIGTNRDGRLEAFATGQDGAIWHTVQIR